MTGHLGVMMLFAACVSAVFGALVRDAPRDQFRFGSRLFLALVAGALALDWLMFLAF